MTSQLSLYNTLNRAKEPFTPIDPAHARLYACGPTVYNYAHIGNARMAVVFDVLARLLRTLYPKVTYVSNITDIEDKIIDAARAAGKPIAEITEKYTGIYNQDMASLNILPPDIQPLATGHIDEMIALISLLLERNLAYEKEGQVLFRVQAYETYGRLSGRSRDEQIAGARVEVAPYKEDPADFVLWKPSTADQPGWDSPWGHGRPGWHIECSAMAEKHLGLPFDIHGGGADLKFPHHENEVAQSCGAHDLPPEDFARFWVHNGFVTVNGEKMSKSLGNVTLVHDLIEQHPGEVIRLALMSAHYRQPLDWNEQIIHQSRQFLLKGYKILNEAGPAPADTGELPAAVKAALCDDLNTPQVMAVLNKLMKSEKDPQKLATGLRTAGAILGIFDGDPAERVEQLRSGADVSSVGEIDEKKVAHLLQERQAARKAKDFARADEIRDELQAMNVVIEDTPEGPKWHRA